MYHTPLCCHTHIYHVTLIYHVIVHLALQEFSRFKVEFEYPELNTGDASPVCHCFHPIPLLPRAVRRIKCDPKPPCDSWPSSVKWIDTLPRGMMQLLWRLRELRRVKVFSAEWRCFIHTYRIDWLYFTDSLAWKGQDVKWLLSLDRYMLLPRMDELRLEAILVHSRLRDHCIYSFL